MCLVWYFSGIFCCFLCLVVVMEQFVGRVFQGGKVTIPKRLRELLGVEDGCYVRLGVVEVVEPKARVKRAEV
jgi:bifunctional DNA-binding transcriptional regulator/antitoxin component of YhaV-PrlF toxin-antitoxin module